MPSLDLAGTDELCVATSNRGFGAAYVVGLELPQSDCRFWPTVIITQVLPNLLLPQCVHRSVAVAVGRFSMLSNLNAFWEFGPTSPRCTKNKAPPRKNTSLSFSVHIAPPVITSTPSCDDLTSTLPYFPALHAAVDAATTTVSRGNL